MTMLVATAEGVGHAFALFVIIFLALILAAWFVAPLFRNRK